MRIPMVAFLASLTTFNASPVLADCAAEIATLFDGGAWDPFARENRRETTVIKSPDGSEAPYSDVLWDGPLRSINCTPHGCFMQIGFASWKGTSFEGPWARSGDTATGDPEEFVRGTNQRLADSVKEPECLGQADLDGQSAVLYRFNSKTEPNEYGSWWGGQYSVWVDLEAKRILRIELADGIASWAPTPSENVQVTTITYDDSIKIEEPK